MGLAWLGAGFALAGCFGCTIAGPPDFIVCPEVFKTTSMLMTVRDSSIRTFLLFINYTVWLFVFSGHQWVPAFSISTQITGRADHLLWGVTLLWIL
jgi:hypothetical protein